MPARPARTVALVEQHPRYWTDAQKAAEELEARLGTALADVFALVDAEGEWEAVCVEVDEAFTPQRWIQGRVLPAGDYAVSQLGRLSAERLIERADGRPPFLISSAEALTGEGEYEPGGETFGLSTRLADQAGLRRIGVNIDVIRPGERSTKYHWHHEEEECFLVLSGTGILQVDGASHPVGAGDFFAKAEGPGRAHQFVNNGDRDLKIVTIGEHRGDEVEYPPAPWEPGQPLPGL